MKLLIFLCTVLCVQSRPMSCDKMCQTNYLIKYGYISPQNENSLQDSSATLNKGFFNLQKEAGIKETGLMDDETMKLMRTPRCGVLYKSRQKRYATRGEWNTAKNRLNETMLTWYLDLSNFNEIKSDNLTRRIIETIIVTVTNNWSRTPLIHFEQVYSKKRSNIIIKFLNGSHNDDYDFDGPGKVLAHAFYPAKGLGGDIHFDLSEKWTLWEKEGEISLFAVALHEMGHSLGLGHSSHKNSVMYAWYNPKNIHLTEDDIRGINSLYSERSSVPTPTTTESTTTTKKYKFGKEKIFIQNSKVFIYLLDRKKMLKDIRPPL